MNQRKTPHAFAFALAAFALLGSAPHASATSLTSYASDETPPSCFASGIQGRPVLGTGIHIQGGSLTKDSYAGAGVDLSRWVQYHVIELDPRLSQGYGAWISADCIPLFIGGALECLLIEPSSACLSDVIIHE